MKGSFSSLHWLLAAVFALALAGCASIGRPQGGPRDITPPEFVNSNPAPQGRNVNTNKINIVFNENVQLDDAFNKVVVSPVQANTPSVSANGRHVTIELKDTLQPNTTYTIDFGDAIKDLNEGNILDGFSTSFSTGDSIDTLRISGMLFEARTLEPAQSMLVGLYRIPDSVAETYASDTLGIDSARISYYSQTNDTSLYTRQLERISRTNQYGQFTIHNLKHGQYAVYAINDVNRDYKWDRTEDVAFLGHLVSPYVEPIQVVDTLRAWDNSDSLVSRAGVAYFPNDLLLTWFNEDYKSQYLKDYSRPSRERLAINMGAPADSLPEIAIAKGPLEGLSADKWTRLNANHTLDSLEYWISDSTVIKTDSLWLAVKYQRTDTNDLLSWKTDTLRFFFKDPVTKDKKKDKDKDKDKNKEKEKKKREKEKEIEGAEGEEINDSIPDAPEMPEITFLNLSPASSGKTQELNLPLVLKSNQPIDTILPDSYRLEIKEDTLWHPVKGITLEVDSLNPLLQRVIRYAWEEGGEYRLTVDSAAVFSMYNQWNNTLKHEFKVKTLEDYSTLTFNVSGLEGQPAIVELLDKSDKVIATSPVIDGTALFEYINPGQVYARLYIDANNDGKWTTGDLKQGLQPEEVYYFNKRLTLRKNWEVTQDWNIYEIALDMQKPYELVKNKPKKNDKNLRQNSYADEEDEDEFNNGSNYGYGGYGTTNYGTTNYGTGNNQYGY